MTRQLPVRSIGHGELNHVLQILFDSVQTRQHDPGRLEEIVRAISEEPLKKLFDSRRDRLLSTLQQAAGDLVATLYRMQLGDEPWDRSVVEIVILRYLNERDAPIAENTRKDRSKGAHTVNDTSRTVRKEWQRRADQEWKHNPQLSKLQCAVRIARGNEKPDTIRRAITKK